MSNRTAIVIFFLLLLLPAGASGQSGDAGISPGELKGLGFYDFVTASQQGLSVGEMVLDIEGAPDRAYDILEYAVFTAAYAIRPRDSEVTALRKVDAILFEHMGFQRGPGTTFTEALTKGVLDCSDASLIYVSAAERAGRDWFAAMAPFHMFVAAPEGEWFIFWETQTGKPFDVYDMINYHGLRSELIEEGVYLYRMSTRHHIAETYRNIGGNLVRNRKLPEALKYLKASIYLLPSHPPTLIWVGYANMLAGDYSRAEYNYLQALNIDPYDWVANLHLGELYRVMGRIEEGNTLIEFSNEYRPSNATWVIEEALPFIEEIN